MQRVLISIITILFLNICYADITGRYTCKGHDEFYSINYSGTLIIKKNDTNYQLVWDVNEPIARFNGSGLFDANKNIMAFMFLNPKESSQSGVGIYTLNPDGSLKGNWTYQYKDQISTEDCTLVSKETS